MRKLLHDKEDHAIGRVFHLLGLAFPTEDFRQIYRGLRSSRPGARASSIELVENLLEPPLRGAVAGLIDDLPDAQRLASSGRFHTPARLDYEALLERMLESESEALQDITVYHVGELGLVGFQDRLEKLRRAATQPRADVQRTLEILDKRAEGEKAAAAC